MPEFMGAAWPVADSAGGMLLTTFAGAPAGTHGSTAKNQRYLEAEKLRLAAKNVAIGTPHGKQGETGDADESVKLVLS